MPSAVASQGLIAFGGLAMREQQRRACAVGQQHPQIAVAAFGDTAEMAGLSGAVFPRCETEPGSELSCTRKAVDVGDRAEHGGRDDDADAGDGHETLHVGVRFGDRRELSVELFDALLEFMPISSRIGIRALSNTAGTPSTTACSRRTMPAAPAGSAIPNSANRPRASVMRWRRVATHCWRMRCRPCSAC